MPDIDEEGRETFRGAEEQDSPPVDVNTEPSSDSSPSDDTIDPEQGTPQQPVVEPVVKEQTVPLTRLQEVIGQRNEAQKQAQLALEIAQKQQQQPSAPSQPTASPWDKYLNSQDPATVQYGRDMQEIMAYERAQAKKEAIAELQPTIDAAREGFASIKTENFMDKNPDIKVGTPEYEAIVAKVAQGYPMEAARKIVMFDVLEQRLANKSVTNKKQATAQKRQANNEISAGIPSSSGLPKATPSFEDDLAIELAKEGIN